MEELFRCTHDSPDFNGKSGDFLYIFCRSGQSRTLTAMSMHLFQHLTMIAQEAGADPGKGLKAWQTLAIFIGIPVGLFAFIAGSVLLVTRKKSN